MKILVADENGPFQAAVIEHLRNFYPEAELNILDNFFCSFPADGLQSYDMIFLDAGMSGIEDAQGLKILLRKSVGAEKKDLLEKYSLTKREEEVLRHLAQGLSNKKIASALNLQVVTVKMHLRGICRKMNVQNRTQAALKASALL